MTDSSALAQRLVRRGSWRLRAKSRASRANRKAKNYKTETSVDLTFPGRLRALAERLYQQAVTHPAFVLMSPAEIQRSLENRLWSIAAPQPLWWGCGPADRREATEAQREALEKARKRKLEIQQEADSHVPEGATSREGQGLSRSQRDQPTPA